MLGCWRAPCLGLTAATSRELTLQACTEGASGLCANQSASPTSIAPDVREVWWPVSQTNADGRQSLLPRVSRQCPGGPARGYSGLSRRVRRPVLRGWMTSTKGQCCVPMGIEIWHEREHLVKVHRIPSSHALRQHRLRFAVREWSLVPRAARRARVSSASRSTRIRRRADHGRPQGRRRGDDGVAGVRSEGIREKPRAHHLKGARPRPSQAAVR